MKIRPLDESQSKPNLPREYFCPSSATRPRTTDLVLERIFLLCEVPVRIFQVCAGANEWIRIARFATTPKLTQGFSSTPPEKQHLRSTKYKIHKALLIQSVQFESFFFVEAKFFQSLGGSKKVRFSLTFRVVTFLASGYRNFGEFFVNPILKNSLLFSHSTEDRSRFKSPMPSARLLQICALNAIVGHRRMTRGVNGIFASTTLSDLH